MAKTDSTERTIVVTGDVTMDWNLARIRRSRDCLAEWNADDQTRACWQRGGVGLIAGLIEAIAEQAGSGAESPIVVRQVDAPRDAVIPGDPRFHHSYAMWSLYPGPDETMVWRVSEFLGLDRGAPRKDHAADAAWPRVPKDANHAELVVLDDGALGFREMSECWPSATTDGVSRPWVLLKMSRPVAEGPLWDKLVSEHADRLIVVMTADDLRGTEVHISRGLSWERTAQDVVWELNHNPRVNALTRCAHVIVSFQTDGAIWLSSDAVERAGQSSAKCHLVFDPVEIEGTWKQRHPGGMVGYGSCLAAGIAREVIIDPANPRIDRGIQAGISAMRRLHQFGYGTGASTEPQLAFPTSAIVDELIRPNAEFSIVAVADPTRRLSPNTCSGGAAPNEVWTILGRVFSDGLEKHARDIVVRGTMPACVSIPIGRFGALETIDRREMESFRSIRNLMAEYCASPQEKPLCLAVFGPPGSGKSFGVNQVAKSILPGQIEKKTFNLSQLEGPEALVDALHQVRDISLSGKIPLIFWDEFDTELNGRELGWLRYFLSPMQDGEFQQGQITHPLGRAIFVFAGGTSKTMQAFDKGEADQDFKDVKGPDFVSRLKGFVDILGPNPNPPTAAGADPYFIVRRAILFRSLLAKYFPQIFERRQGGGGVNIDTGVLRAFLNVSRFKHGARSMEAILAMSRVGHTSRLERSCLPADDQLNLHVNAVEFLALVQQLEFEGELLEKMAEAAHDVYREGKERDGWVYGEPRDDAKKRHPLLVAYSQLPEKYKDANRTTVRNIPQKVAAAGYVIRPARSDETPIEFSEEDIEILARLEHELWMQDRIRAGFKPGPENQPMSNPYLEPWDDLPKTIQQIDRDLIAGIPRILSKAGYTVMKSRE